MEDSLEEEEDPFCINVATWTICLWDEHHNVGQKMDTRLAQFEETLSPERRLEIQKKLNVLNARLEQAAHTLTDVFDGVMMEVEELIKE